MGNQYMTDENIRRHMISHFKNAKVISLPQTIYFTDDKNGKKEFEKSKRIYNKNKNLVVILMQLKDEIKRHYISFILNKYISQLKVKLY